jgi:iron complex outermembrane recepter protein
MRSTTPRSVRGETERPRGVRALLCLTASTLAIGAWAPAAAAAEAAVADDNSVSEVVVTARRREESLLEIPVAVSVTSGDTLRTRDITTAPDLIKLTPGLTAQLGANQSRRTSRFAIRGQGGNPGVGVVTYFAEVPEIGTQFFDLENVQVLKGPVGTLFGRVTTGGAILFTPKMPGKDMEGFIDAKVGQYGRRDVEFAIGGELAEDLVAVRLSGQVLKSHGFTRNLYDGGRLDGKDGQSFRAVVKLTPTSSITNTTIGLLDYVQDPGRSGPMTLVRQFNAGNASLNAGNTQHIAPSIAALNGIACPANICPTWLAFAQQNVAAQAARSVYVVNENNVNYPRPNQRQVGLINTTVFDLTENIRLKNIASYQKTTDTGPMSQAIDSSPLPMLEQVSLARPGARGLTEELQLQATCSTTAWSSPAADSTKRPGRPTTRAAAPFSGAATPGKPCPRRSARRPARGPTPAPTASSIATSARAARSEKPATTTRRCSARRPST